MQTPTYFELYEFYPENIEEHENHNCLVLYKIHDPEKPNYFRVCELDNTGAQVSSHDNDNFKNAMQYLVGKMVADVSYTTEPF